MLPQLPNRLAVRVSRDTCVTNASPPLWTGSHGVSLHVHALTVCDIWSNILNVVNSKALSPRRLAHACLIKAITRH